MNNKSILCSLFSVVNIVSLIFLLVFGWLMKLITKQAHALNLPCVFIFRKKYYYYWIFFGTYEHHTFFFVWVQWEAKA